MKSLLRSPDTSGLNKPSSGNVRFCTFTVPSYPEPIRGNPNLRAESPNRNTALNGQCNTQPGTTKSLHRVAVCCTVSQCVAPCRSVFRPKIFSAFTCNISSNVDRVPSRGAPWLPLPADRIGQSRPISTLKKCENRLQTVCERRALGHRSQDRTKEGLDATNILDYEALTPNIPDGLVPFSP